MSDSRHNPSPTAEWVTCAPGMSFHWQRWHQAQGRLTSAFSEPLPLYARLCFCPPSPQFPLGCFGPLDACLLACSSSASMCLCDTSLGIHTVLTVVLCDPVTVCLLRPLAADTLGRGHTRGPGCSWVLILSLFPRVPGGSSCEEGGSAQRCHSPQSSGSQSS